MPSENGLRWVGITAQKFFSYSVSCYLLWMLISFVVFPFPYYVPYVLVVLGCKCERAIGVGVYEFLVSSYICRFVYVFVSSFCSCD